MTYANPDDQIKWRENNRDYFKTPDQRKKQKLNRINKRKKVLENLPDKYEYNHTNKEKSKMKYHWIKRKGLRKSDFERTWDRYVNTTHCEICDISLKKVKKNMDHCHKSGYMRFIVCQRCNTFLRYHDKYYDEVLSKIDPN
jgi:hypothetical protein